MRVIIRNIKTGLRDIETNVKKIRTLKDGRIVVTSDNSCEWVTVSTVYKDSIIEKIEA